MKRLEEEQLAVWRAFVNAHAALIERIEQDLSAHRKVPLTTYDILVALYQSPGQKLRMSELAGKVVITRSGLTRAVERLEKEGLVARERTDEDRRGAYAVLTRDGKKAFLDAWPIYEEGIRKHFIDGLDEEEQQAIERGLNKIYRGLRQSRQRSGEAE